MGQLVQFEKELLSSPNNSQKLDIEVYLPSSHHVELSEAIRQSAESGGSSTSNTPEPRSAGATVTSASVEKSGQPFLLKMPKPRKRNQKQQNVENSLSEKDSIRPACTSVEIHSLSHSEDVSDSSSHSLFPHSSPSSNVNDSLSTLPSSSSAKPAGVKDIVKRFERSD